MVRKVSDDELIALIDSGKTVLVDFYADWCGPCKAMVPVVQELSELLPDVEIVKVDIDADRSVAGRLGVRGIPTFAMFVGGEAKGMKSGALSLASLRNFVETNKS